MLDRLGGERARATSLVRYAPGSHFPGHAHPGGEEILVLAGMFSEGDDDNPSGCYMRNPPGSSHQPSSVPGATLFVKLWQMPAGERRRVRIDTRDPAAWRIRDGQQVCELFSGEREQVCLQRCAAGGTLLSVAPGGAELLVLEGSVQVEGRACPAGSWIRLPAGDPAQVTAGAQGALCYVKTGHLPPAAPEMPA